MARKELRFPDVYDDTGAAVPVVSYIPEAKNRGFGQIYRMLSTRVLEDFSTRDGRAALGPIMTLVACMDAALLHIETFGPQDRAPLVPLTSVEIGEKISRSKRQVLRYLKELEALEYISRHGKTNKQKIYLNPDMFYTGSARGISGAQIEFKFGEDHHLVRANKRNEHAASAEHDDWQKKYGKEKINF